MKCSVSVDMVDGNYPHVRVSVSDSTGSAKRGENNLKYLEADIDATSLQAAASCVYDAVKTRLSDGHVPLMSRRGGGWGFEYPYISAARVQDAIDYSDAPRILLVGKPNETGKKLEGYFDHILKCTVHTAVSILDMASYLLQNSYDATLFVDDEKAFWRRGGQVAKMGFPMRIAIIAEQRGKRCLRNTKSSQPDFFGLDVFYNPSLDELDKEFVPGRWETVRSRHKNLE